MPVLSAVAVPVLVTNVSYNGAVGSVAETSARPEPVRPEPIREDFGATGVVCVTFVALLKPVARAKASTCVDWITDCIIDACTMTRSTAEEIGLESTSPV